MGSIKGQFSKGKHHVQGDEQIKQGGGRKRNAPFSWEEGRSMTERKRGIWGLNMALKHGQGQGGKAPWSSHMEKENVCVRSSTLHASMKALRSFTHKELESAFSFTKTPFYNKRMSFKHVALIPTLLDQFSSFMCIAAGLCCMFFSVFHFGIILES